MKDRIHQISNTELAKLPVEQGVVKVIVLDGITNRGFEAECPVHGDTVAHMHNGKFQKMIVQDEYKV